MSDTVIRVEGLGKKFKIGSQQPYHRFSEVVSGFGSQLAKAPARLFRKQRQTEEKAVEKRADEFWALKEINFEVKQGDVVGIIGRNGAGKSTLLKILSRITEPTEGRFGLKGRVASLLEVGTGFHPELTGRENIFLSGSVLGMTRAEIKRKFDEIVDFAGIEQFLDTPVKRYSSGMQVRLGFAVAAHLEPEILIVDEVLAVGDAEFQKKCLGKMNDVAQSGRTILFVSHNMAAVRELCNRSLLLEHGSLHVDDTSPNAIRTYLSIGEDISCVTFEDDMSLPCQVLCVSVHSEDQTVRPRSEFSTLEHIIIKISVKNLSKEPRLIVVLRIRNDTGDVILMLDSRDSRIYDNSEKFLRSYSSEYLCMLTAPLLRDGRYYISIDLRVPGKSLNTLEDCVSFTVADYVSANKNREGFVIQYPKWQALNGES